MYKSYDEKADPAGAAKAGKCDPAGEAHIGDQHKDGGKELQKCPVDAFDFFDKFMEQNYCGIETGRAQTEKNPDEMVISHGQIAKACNQHNAKGGHKKADPLFGRHFFFKQNGAGYRYNDRRKVIAECGNGNRGVFVCLKKQYPVKSHGYA